MDETRVRLEVGGKESETLPLVLLSRLGEAYDGIFLCIRIFLSLHFLTLPSHPPFSPSLPLSPCLSDFLIPKSLLIPLPLLFQREQGLGSVRGLVNLEKKTCFWK